MAVAAGEKVLAVDITAASTRIIATPVTTSTAGDTSNSATDVRDTQLGNYVCTTLTGHTYRVWWTGKVASDNATSLVTITIRDGGGSTPTALSTAIATGARNVTTAGGGGQQTLVVANLWAPTAGTHTLSAFIARAVAGTVTPVGFRELYVEDMGVI